MGGRRTSGETAPTAAGLTVGATSAAPAGTAPAVGTSARTWGPTILAGALCVVLLFTWQAAFFASHHPVIDHVAYRQQAEELLDGDLTLPDDVTAPTWAVRFTAPSDHGRIFKYLPGTAALGAASIAVTGEVGLALAVALVGLVVATSGVAARLGWSATRRGLAAFLVGASPVVLSSDAVLLSYVPALALATVALWMVLAAVGPGVDDDPARRRRTAGLLVGAGLVLGAALLVRQIEIVAWLGVLLGWCVLRSGASTALRVRRAALLLAGVVPGVVVVLLFNRAVTGSFLQFPFTVVSPDDGLGWGLRRVLPTDALETFRLVDGLRTTPRAGFDLVMWTLAGPALAVGAAVSVWRGRRSPATWLLVALAGSIPVAFLFHWANAHAVWAGFYMTVGPFYYLACVPPLVLLGIDGLARLPRRPVVAGVALALLLQAAFLADHLHDQFRQDHVGTGLAAPSTAAAAPR